MNASGAFAVMWDNNAGRAAAPLRQHRRGAWAARSTSTPGSSAGNGSVAVADDGSAVVVWREGVLERTVHLQRYNAAGSAVGGAVTVNSTGLFDQTHPSIAVDGQGNFIVAWEGNGPGDASGVFAQKFNAAGVAVGGEFRLNQGTGGTQAQVSLAMLDLDNFVGVWSGQGPGDASGVFSRQFGNLSYAPVITSHGGAETVALGVAENTTAVTTVTATDADLPAQTLVYTIAGGADAGLFTVGAGSGVLSFQAPPDFEARADANGDNVYDVVIKVSDGSLAATPDLCGDGEQRQRRRAGRLSRCLRRRRGHRAGGHAFRHRRRQPCGQLHARHAAVQRHALP